MRAGILIVALTVALLEACDAPAPTPTFSSPVDGADVADIALACWGVDEDECERALAAAANLLPAGHPPVVAASVVAFGCDFLPCLNGLRRGGTVSIEFENGGGLRAWSIAALRDGSLALGDHSSGLPQPFLPRSARLADPVAEISLGHCGLFSPIDVDGSFWDPVGRVDSNAPETVNSSRGTFTLTDPDRATFRAATGFVVDLRRHHGAKSLQGCA